MYDIPEPGNFASFVPRYSPVEILERKQEERERLQAEAEAKRKTDEEARSKYWASKGKGPEGNGRRGPDGRLKRPDFIGNRAGQTQSASKGGRGAGSEGGDASESGSAVPGRSSMPD